MARILYVGLPAQRPLFGGLARWNSFSPIFFVYDPAGIPSAWAVAPTYMTNCQVSFWQGNMVAEPLCMWVVVVTMRKSSIAPVFSTALRDLAKRSDVSWNRP